MVKYNLFHPKSVHSYRAVNDNAEYSSPQRADVCYESGHGNIHSNKIGQRTN